MVLFDSNCVLISPNNSPLVLNMDISSSESPGRGKSNGLHLDFISFFFSCILFSDSVCRLFSAFELSTTASDDIFSDSFISFGILRLYIHSPIDPLEDGESLLAQLCILSKLANASSLVTALIHSKPLSTSFFRNFDGSFKNSSILPHAHSIFLTVIGFNKIFSSFVTHLKFSGRLLRRLVSIWSTTYCDEGGSPWNAVATILCTLSPAILAYPVLSSYLPKVHLLSLGRGLSLFLGCRNTAPLSRTE